jgi:hypothetical protein
MRDELGIASHAYTSTSTSASIRRGCDWELGQERLAYFMYRIGEYVM